MIQCIDHDQKPHEQHYDDNFIGFGGILINLKKFPAVQCKPEYYKIPGKLKYKFIDHRKAEPQILKTQSVLCK